MTIRWLLLVLVSLGILGGCSEPSDQQNSVIDEVSTTADLAWQKAADLAETARSKSQAAIEASQLDGEAFEAARLEANEAMKAAESAWREAQQFAEESISEVRVEAVVAYDKATELWQSIYSGGEHEH